MPAAAGVLRSSVGEEDDASLPLPSKAAKKKRSTLRLRFLPGGGSRAGTIGKGGGKGGGRNDSQQKQDKKTENGGTAASPARATAAAAPTVAATSSAPSPSASAASSPRSPRSRRSAASSFLCRTRYFRRLCDWAFEAIDTDKSGSVDEKELYSGLLLIHLKLGSLAGPAACRPLDRQQCSAVFEMMDVDDSGSLDKKEFEEVMMVLFSNVLLRVLILWSMTIMIVPLISQRMLDAIYRLCSAFAALVQNLDERSWIADRIELALEGGVDALVGATPAPILAAVDKVGGALALVPTAVWNSIPLTLVSTILGTLVVPWLLVQVDAFFQSLANRRKPKTA